jgi:hypothetical protein
LRKSYPYRKKVNQMLDTTLSTAKCRPIYPWYQKVHIFDHHPMRAFDRIYVHEKISVTNNQIISSTCLARSYLISVHLDKIKHIFEASPTRQNVL